MPGGDDPVERCVGPVVRGTVNRVVSKTDMRDECDTGPSWSLFKKKRLVFYGLPVQPSWWGIIDP